MARFFEGQYENIQPGSFKAAMDQRQIERQIEALDRQVEAQLVSVAKARAALQADLDRITAWGDDPFEDGAVILFERQFAEGGKFYNYAAIRWEGLWSTTGPQSPKSYLWHQLMRWLDEAPNPVEIYHVTQAEELEL